MTTGPQLAPRRAVSRLAVRQIRLGAVAVALICGGISAMVASEYRPIGDLLDEPGLRALGENPAVRILSGPPVALDDPGGFTVWRTGPAVSVLVGVWILLAATRITRGEEDGRRWDLLLAGRLRMADVVVRCLTALVGSATLIGMAVAAGLLAARTEPAGAIIYGAGITCVGLTFATTALLAAQVMPRRSGATGLAVAALGVGLMLRMIADGSHQLAWLAWATPFGLIGRAAPYADNRIAPLIVSGAFPIVLAGAALVAGRHRDLGDGIVVLHHSRPPRPRLLHSTAGFALRRTGRTTSGWAAGIAAYFFLVGAVLASIIELFQTNPRLAELARAGGMGGHDMVHVVAAALFSLLTVPTGLYAALRLATMVADEKAGLWTLLLAQPISRAHLMSTEIMVTVWGVVALHCSAAVAVWFGTKITGISLQLSASLAGALNSLPMALLAAGAAAVGVGWLPSAAAAIGALPVVGGFLVNVIMQSTKAPSWVANLSPWTHLAAVPGTPPNWGAAAIFLLVAAILAGIGVYGYAQRDLAT
ncbi:exporter of polyketide antibiotics [Mycobacterium sp. MFM001]|uniref:ABC transporter permease n=1 Tax=Mycobacterium sp. MFM001 TaxID=2049453 RepID=UPI000DA4804B|nr:ABC transporter [Mycobacterium sp. MFM001]GBE68120.1 exporter of polyketide antibiotics [Mycobacterium sp. MFM001]